MRFNIECISKVIIKVIIKKSNVFVDSTLNVFSVFGARSSV